MITTMGQIFNALLRPGRHFSLYLVLILLVPACASTPEGPLSANNALLWKIEKNNLAPSYLYGTIHSDDPRIVDVASVVVEAISNTQTFAMEMVIDTETEQKAGMSLFFRDGRTLDRVAGKDLYQRTINALAKRGIETQIARMMKPWGAYSILNMPEAQTKVFLDVVLMNKAREFDKNIIGLETVEEQIATFDSLDMSIQLDLLETCLDNMELLQMLLKESIEVYLDRDLVGIEHLNERFMQLSSPDAAKVFDHKVIVERNKRMVKRSLPLLNKGTVFIAVGALHLPGDSGLISMFRSQGYTLTAVY